MGNFREAGKGSRPKEGVPKKEELFSLPRVRLLEIKPHAVSFTVAFSSDVVPLPPHRQFQGQRGEISVRARALRIQTATRSRMETAGRLRLIRSATGHRRMRLRVARDIVPTSCVSQDILLHLPAAPGSG